MLDDLTIETLGDEAALYQNAIDNINQAIENGAQYSGTQLKNTGPSMSPANGPGGTLQYDWSRYANPNVQMAINTIRTAAAKKALNDTLTELYRQAKKNYQDAYANSSNGGTGGTGGNGGTNEVDVSNGRVLKVNGITLNGEPIDTSNTAQIVPTEQSDAIRQAEEYLGVSPTDWDNVNWETGKIENKNNPKNRNSVLPSTFPDRDNAFNFSI